jgi:polar amino acid transport system substrate-binding protein
MTTTNLPADIGFFAVDPARQVLTRFVEDMKASGFVAAALARQGIEGACVAPAA